MRRRQTPGRRTWTRAARLAAVVLLAVPTLLFSADLTPQQQIESRLMCYCGCSDLTVRTCTCGTADGIRQEIGSRLARGESPDQVVAAFIARYGAQIRSAPTKRGFDLLAWSTPYVALFVAGTALVLLVRRWGRGGRRAAAGPLPAAVNADAPQTPADREIMKRIEREIREGR